MLPPGITTATSSLWLQLTLASCWGAVVIGWGLWSNNYWVQLMVFLVFGFVSEYVMTGNLTPC